MKRYSKRIFLNRIGSLEITSSGRAWLLELQQKSGYGVHNRERAKLHLENLIQQAKTYQDLSTFNE